MSPCFQVHPNDNVATLLKDAAAGTLEVINGDERYSLPLLETVKLGHKIALVAIQPGDAVIKHGFRIGHATKVILRGAWVHLHNLASDLDERSNTLDLHSGAPTDTVYE
jgi:altronate dehydratase small subunit